MKLSGIEAITLPTQRSWRSSITISATIFFILTFNVPLKDLSILNVMVPLNFLGAVSWALLFFSTVNHVMNWCGDLFSYQKWYQTNAVSVGAWKKVGEQPSPPAEKIRELLASIEHELKEIKKRSEKNTEAIQSLSDDIDNLMIQLNNNFRTIHFYARLYIFVWYLGVPIVAALLAALALLCEAS